MTPQQHKQHLLALADRFERMEWLDTDLDEIEAALRDFAARLTPGVITDELIEKCWLAERRDQIRKSLEAVFPLVDETAKDAARYSYCCERGIFPIKNIQKLPFPKLLGWTFDDLVPEPEYYPTAAAAIDAAMAAPPKDTTP